jgi:hypothetical protein
LKTISSPSTLYNRLLGLFEEISPMYELKKKVSKKTLAATSLFEETEVVQELSQIFPFVYTFQRATNKVQIGAYILEFEERIMVFTGTTGDFRQGLPGIPLFYIPLYTAAGAVNLSHRSLEYPTEQAWATVSETASAQEMEELIATLMAQTTLRQYAQKLKDALRIWEANQLRTAKYHEDLIKQLKHVRDAVYSIKVPNQQYKKQVLDTLLRHITKHEGLIALLKEGPGDPQNLWAYTLQSLAYSEELPFRSGRKYYDILFANALPKSTPSVASLIPCTGADVAFALPASLRLLWRVPQESKSEKEIYYINKPGFEAWLAWSM